MNNTQQETYREHLRAKAASKQMNQEESLGSNISPVSGNALQPLIDKFAVPVAWFAAGYIVCMLMDSRKKGRSTDANG